MANLHRRTGLNEKMNYSTAAATIELDQILDLICVNLQLTKSQYDDAEGKYQAVGNWLGASGSPLAEYEPEIFTQGSLRLDTTVKPLGHTEFDLDLVCKIKLTEHQTTPQELYDMILGRVKSNGRYSEILQPMDRCIRLNYANSFHLDIVPAIPASDCGPGETRIVIPDKAKRVWRCSDPKGYAIWFDEMTEKRMLLKAAALHERANIEPLRTPSPYSQKPPLKLAVQLIKRWRDIYFKHDPNGLAPSSIILTTLAGQLYVGEDTPTYAISGILNGIIRLSWQGPIRLENPSNPGEWITDRWHDRPEMYDAFLNAIYDFRNRWTRLIEFGQFPEFLDDLKQLFEDPPVTSAFVKFAEGRTALRRGGKLWMDRTTGVILTAEGNPRSTVQIKDHTFFGDR